MSTAGAFYALAAFGASRDGLLAVAGTRRAASVALGLLLVLLAIGWSVRSAGVHYVLRSQAVKHQVDWAELPGRWRRSGEWPSDAARERLIQQLRDDAVHMALPNTRLDHPEWPARIWIE
jgi:hypothetical protein